MGAEIRIEGYLLQGKLETALKQIVGEASWRGRELRVPGSRRRWDMAFEVQRRMTVVEFDGDQHYWDSLKIKVDAEKDAVARTLGYSVVRIPYWVQLDAETAAHYFGWQVSIAQDFPHGFITTKIFPASFSEKGVERFAKEFDALPATTRRAVVYSLRERAKEHGIEYVLPTSLRHII